MLELLDLLRDLRDGLGSGAYWVGSGALYAGFNVSAGLSGGLRSSVWSEGRGDLLGGLGGRLGLRAGWCWGVLSWCLRLG